MDKINIESRMEVPSGTFDYDRWLTKDDLKQHLNIEGTDEDDLLDDYIKAAVEHVESLTGRSLANHTMYYLFDAGQKCTYLFDGIAVDYTNIEVKEHTDLKDFFDFDNQDDVTFNFSNNPGTIKSVFVETTDKVFVAIKAPVVWVPANHPIIKTILFTLCATMYKDKEITVRDNSISKVIKSQIRKYVRI